MYIELHARSAFSFLEGSSIPEELVVRAAELDFPALAILDTDNISGAARFHMAAKKAKLRAHIVNGAHDRFPAIDQCIVPIKDQGAWKILFHINML